MARAHQYSLDFRVFRRNLTELAAGLSEDERSKAEAMLAFAADIRKVVDYLAADAEAVAAFEADQIILADLSDPLLARRMIETARRHDLFHRLGDESFDAMADLVDSDPEGVDALDWEALLKARAEERAAPIGIGVLVRSEIVEGVYREAPGASENVAAVDPAPEHPLGDAPPSDPRPEGDAAVDEAAPEGPELEEPAFEELPAAAAPDPEPEPGFGEPEPVEDASFDGETEMGETPGPAGFSSDQERDEPPSAAESETGHEAANLRPDDPGEVGLEQGGDAPDLGDLSDLNAPAAPPGRVERIDRPSRPAAREGFRRGLVSSLAAVVARNGGDHGRRAPGVEEAAGSGYDDGGYVADFSSLDAPGGGSGVSAREQSDAHDFAANVDPADLEPEHYEPEDFNPADFDPPDFDPEDFNPEDFGAEGFERETGAQADFEPVEEEDDGEAVAAPENGHAAGAKKPRWVPFFRRREAQSEAAGALQAERMSAPPLEVEEDEEPEAPAEGPGPQPESAAYEAATAGDETDLAVEHDEGPDWSEEPEWAEEEPSAVEEALEDDAFEQVAEPAAEVSAEAEAPAPVEAAEEMAEPVDDASSEVEAKGEVEPEPEPEPESAEEPAPIAAEPAAEPEPLERATELVFWNIGAGSSQLYVEIGYKLVLQRLPKTDEYFDTLRRLATGERTRKSAIEALAATPEASEGGARWRVFWL